MESFWHFFNEVCKRPHCSAESEALRTYIISTAEDFGYQVAVDRAFNIMAYHKEAKLTLQSHYDMVCMGAAPDIRIEKDDKKMWAKESSLGADNGIGIAMMLEAMQKGLAVDLLFTSDEEIGLIGANALELEIKTERVLNLDTEEEKAVFIGCAGGVDLLATQSYPTVLKEAELFVCHIEGLPGGHSGVDIDKNLPNAMLELLKRIKNQSIELVSFKGGERRNSIPKAAEIRYIKKDFTCVIEGEQSLGKQSVQSIDHSKTLLQFLAQMPHGIHAMNEKLMIPESSLNFAFLTIEKGNVRMEFSLRAMADESMKQMLEKLRSDVGEQGFAVSSEGKYPAWKPERNAFSEYVASKVKAVEGEVNFKAIHAGLECGVLQSKAKSAQFASIGPNIFFPHSTREYVELASVERFRRIVFDVISGL